MQSKQSKIYLPVSVSDRKPERPGEYPCLTAHGGDSVTNWFFDGSRFLGDPFGTVVTHWLERQMLHTFTDAELKARDMEVINTYEHRNYFK